MIGQHDQGRFALCDCIRRRHLGGDPATGLGHFFRGGDDCREGAARAGSQPKNETNEQPFEGFRGVDHRGVFNAKESKHSSISGVSFHSTIRVRRAEEACHFSFHAAAARRSAVGGVRHRNTPRIGRVLIARGRDAADVAISSTFGPNTLKSFKVRTDEVRDA